MTDGLVGAQPPDFATCTKVFEDVDRAVRSRIASLCAPSAAAPPDALMGSLPDLATPDSIGGVSITLWLDGQRIAKGSSLERRTSVGSATTAALDELSRRFPSAGDTLTARARADELARVLVSLECAGQLVPVELASFAQAQTLLHPALDGVAARGAPRSTVPALVPAQGPMQAQGFQPPKHAQTAPQTVGVFPFEMLRGRDTPAGGLVSSVVMLTSDPTLPMPGVAGHDARDIANARGVTYLRFRTAHLAQLSPGTPPVLISRSGAIVRKRDITGDALREFADRLAAHLHARGTEAAGRHEAWGAIYPLQGGQVAFAGPFEKALAAYAVFETARARGVGVHALNNTPPDRATLWAMDVLFDMLGLDPPLRDADITPRVGAMLTLALCASGEAGLPAAAWRDHANQRVRDTMLACVEPTGAWKAVVPTGDRGLVAYALVKLAMRPGAVPGDDAIARGAVRAAFAESTPQSLASQMPWLGRAEIVLAGGTSSPIPAATALRDMRAMLWTSQVRPEQVESVSAGTTAGIDLAGGLDLDSNALLSPTAQTARPLGFLAAMVCDDRLTPREDRMREVSNVLAGARFLRQLSCDESLSFAITDPGLSSSGVWASPWDASQPIEASAMTLLTTGDILDMLDSLARSPQ